MERVKVSRCLHTRRVSDTLKPGKYDIKQWLKSEGGKDGEGGKMRGALGKRT
jgi:hypothetical protein